MKGKEKQQKHLIYSWKLRRAERNKDGGKNGNQTCSMREIQMCNTKTDTCFTWTSSKSTWATYSYTELISTCLPTAPSTQVTQSCPFSVLQEHGHMQQTAGRTGRRGGGKFNTVTKSCGRRSALLFSKPKKNLSFSIFINRNKRYLKTLIETEKLGVLAVCLWRDYKLNRRKSLSKKFITTKFFLSKAFTRFFLIRNSPF